MFNGIQSLVGDLDTIIEDNLQEVVVPSLSQNGDVPMSLMPLKPENILVSSHHLSSVA